MPRPKSNVIPFRPRPRKWTRPEDYTSRGNGPRPPKPPKGPRPGWQALAAWALIAAIVALTVGWHFWG